MALASLADAEALDRADPLGPFRARFRLPAGIIYLDGNSLGALPAITTERVEDAVARQWGEGLIRSWNSEGWIDAPRRVGDKIGRIIGAEPGAVIVADSTSVNLFKLVMAAAALAPGRGTILAESGNFPTDLHIARQAAGLLGRALKVAPSHEIAAAMDDDTAVVVLPQVHYRSGWRHDMAALERAAASAGALIVWDLSHSAGAIPLELAREGARLAVGCGYKFLNGGPGAPAFLYVADELAERMQSPVAGWFGHKSPFDFEDDYRPAPGVERFLAGTPPILSLVALEAGVDLMLEADSAALWRKSCALFDLFRTLAEARCPGLKLLTPSAPDQRGSQIAFAHPNAFEIVQALIAGGVIGDFRTPDVMRFGLTPLTIGYAEVWHAVDRLAVILAEGRWRDPRFAVRARVT